MNTAVKLPEHLKINNIINAFNSETSEKEINEKVKNIVKNSSYTIKTIDCEDTWKK